MDNSRQQLKKQVKKHLPKDWLCELRIAYRILMEAVNDIKRTGIINLVIITTMAAILTILFLVFSFYSIYKMDELRQQGNDGVKDIRSLKKSSEDIIEKLEATSKLEIEKTQNKIDGFIVEQQQRMVQTFSLIDSEKTNKLNDINNCFEDACAIVEQIRELKDNIRNENGQSKS